MQKGMLSPPSCGLEAFEGLTKTVQELVVIVWYGLIVNVSYGRI